VIFFSSLTYDVQVMSFSDCDNSNNNSSNNASDNAGDLILTFGIIADVQHSANVSDCVVYGRKRFYESSLDLVRKCVNEWKQYELSSMRKLTFVLQMGDLFDGFRYDGDNKSTAARANMRRVLDELHKMYDEHDFESQYARTSVASSAASASSATDDDYDGYSNNDNAACQVKLLHIWGNHELQGFTRSELRGSPLHTSQMLGQQNVSIAAAATASNYYTYELGERLRLICLDMYEFSPLGYSVGEPIYEAAVAFLEHYDKLAYECTTLHDNKDHQEAELNYLKRFKMYGGAISDQQRAWFINELAMCKQQGKKVIVCGHIPISDKIDAHVSWDAENLVSIIEKYAECVLAYISGHYHPGGHYYEPTSQVHHICVKSVLESEPNMCAPSMIVNVYERKIVIEQNYHFKRLEIVY
jgi:hypothetical protein